MTNWASLAIGKKLSFCFGMGVVSLLVVAGFALSGALSGGTAFKEYSQTSNKLRLVYAMSEDLYGVRLAVKHFQVNSESGGDQTFKSKFEDLKAKLQSVGQFEASASLNDSLAALSADLDAYETEAIRLFSIDEKKTALFADILDAQIPTINDSLQPLRDAAFASRNHDAGFRAAQTKTLVTNAINHVINTLTTSADEGAHASEAFQKAFAELDKLIPEVEGQPGGPLALELKSRLQKIVTDFDVANALGAQRTQMVNVTLTETATALTAQMSALSDAARASGDVVAERISAGFQQQPFVIAGVVVVGVLATIAAALLLIRSIVGPLVQVTSVLKSLREGKTDIQICSNGRGDEIGVMMDAAASLRETVRLAFVNQQIVEQMPTPVMMANPNDDFKINFMNPAMATTMDGVANALPVKVGELYGVSIDVLYSEPEKQRAILSDPNNLPHSGRLNCGSQRFSVKTSAIHDNEGQYVGSLVVWDDITEREALAETVGDAVQRVMGSVGEASNYTQRLSDVSTDAQEKSVSVSAAAEEATQNVQSVASAAEELAASISEISQQVASSSNMAAEATGIADDTKQRASALAESSQKIGDIVKVISDIAEQTNLLALNATIEAARAGDAGRGFAVVANEVKALAEQTSKATVEIGQQITAMQGITGETVKQIDTVTARINEISDTLANVAAAAEEQGSATQEISRSVQEAATGTQQVSHNITGVRNASAETDEAAEKLTGITQQLSGISSELGHAADEFLEKVRAA